ncbi:hypothetical protein [Catellatospora chokoriensis]|uniref:Uncharacterized protein n=1 Tax=Catellatospora chokoriensis TaxID=310353 RepID=A0A8J3JYI2_9ACTN|nr:hypothetical protein [Catellatospora chokoriensis]GIF89318.1 hypothetical protein Cch02nite_27620 [Catellatospora chokoriensis]
MPKSRRDVRARRAAAAARLQPGSRTRTRSALTEARSWQQAGLPAALAGTVGLVLSILLAAWHSWLMPAVAVGAALLNLYAAYVVVKARRADEFLFPQRWGSGRCSVRGEVVSGVLALAAAVLAVIGFASR